MKKYNKIKRLIRVIDLELNSKGFIKVNFNYMIEEKYFAPIPSTYSKIFTKLDHIAIIKHINDEFYH